MIAYVPNTHGSNLPALRAAGFRILITPGRRDRIPPAGFRYSIDNGAWGVHQSGDPFDGEGFRSLVHEYGRGAEFVVIPDIVAGGDRSLAFSKLWIDELKHLRLILLPVQDGVNTDDVGAVLERHPNMGLFLGGSAEWKLRTMYGWGMVAHAMRRYYHIGRVNTTRRIRLAAEAGADSFDGSSPVRFSCNIPKIAAGPKQPSLLTPAILSRS